MRGLVDRIQTLINAGEVRISEHGYDEMTDDDLAARELITGVSEAIVIEEYLDYPKGPCILVLQKDRTGNPVHVVWGIPKGLEKPAVLVTAYRPNPDQWDNSFLQRRR